MVTPSSAGISVIVLTHNEARDLPALLASLGWCDDVHVVDDGSTDATWQVAEAGGATCYLNPFVSFGQQRNWALQNAKIRHPWILFLDADEVSTPSFAAAAAKAAAAAPAETAGFYCCWKLMLNGTWLRRCDGFPKWQLRLVRKGRVTFVDFGHGQKEGEVEGVLDYLREPYLHYAFSKGWTAWFDRHNRYSSQEAVARRAAPVSWKAILSRTPSVRNMALKPLVTRIPGWPLVRFFCDYVLRGGFLEGRSGLVYCVNMAIYEYMIVLKASELPGAGGK